MGFLPCEVNAVLAVDEESITNNIKGNLDLIPNWFGQMFYPNGYSGMIISAGPSMEKYVEEQRVKERMDDPEDPLVVFCVKHALPRLVAMGVEPHFCVILDGRPLDANSTHGVHRKSLFKDIPEKTIFLVASMTNPSYAEYLVEQGARILGWHTSVKGLKDFVDRGIVREPVINGGTSSGTRAIGIATALGIRDITLIGFDSCINDPTPEKLQELDSKGRPKYMPVDLPVFNPKASEEQQDLLDTLTKLYTVDGLGLQASLTKRFYSTGELLAQAQDFEVVFTNPNLDFQIKVFDDGIVNHMFHNIDNRVKRAFDFVEYLNAVAPKKETKGTVKAREILL